MPESDVSDYTLPRRVNHLLGYGPITENDFYTGPATPSGVKPWEVFLNKTSDPTAAVIYESVGRSLSAWEDAEIAILHLYAVLLHIPVSEALLIEEYVAAAGFRGRIDLLEKAADKFFQKRCCQVYEGRFNKIAVPSRGLSLRRNDIAHGIVREEIAKDKVKKVIGYILVPPFYIAKKFLGDTVVYAWASREINYYTKQFQSIRLYAWLLSENLKDDGPPWLGRPPAQPS